MKEFIINANDAGQRLDKFLTKAVPLLPPALLYKSIRLKRIKRNGKRCEISDRLAVGDVLSLYINDEFFDAPAEDRLFLRAPATLSIVYEDKNILLIDKNPGLIVHEDDEHQIDTLINRVLHYLYDKNEYEPDKENSFTPSLCNRIDLNTGGIVIAAKNATALRILNEKIKLRELSKQYLCVVHGVPSPKTATLKGFLRKDAKENMAQIFDHPVPDGRTVLTRYRVLASNPRFALVEIDLLTGRTHQIRAHMASIGHPLLGDTKYGRNRDNKDTGYRFQALYSYKLTFDFQTDAGTLAYLNQKSFEVPHVWFRDDFMAGKIK